MKKKQQKLILSFFGGKSKLNGGQPSIVPRADGKPLFDGVEEAQDHWKRNFLGFLADSLLESGEGGCLPACVIDGLLQIRLEILDWRKGGDARRVGFFGNKLDLFSQEGEGVVCHVGASQIYLPPTPSVPDPICP